MKLTLVKAGAHYLEDKRIVTMIFFTKTGMDHVI